MSVDLNVKKVGKFIAVVVLALTLAFSPVVAGTASADCVPPSTACGG